MIICFGELVVSGYVMVQHMLVGSLGFQNILIHCVTMDNKSYSHAACTSVMLSLISLLPSCVPWHNLLITSWNDDNATYM